MFASLLGQREPAQKIAAHRARLRFVNGIEWLIRDPRTVVGRTPFDVVLKQDKLTVRRYRPPRGTKRRRHRVPLLLVPPLMVKPFIFDLRPGRSLASFMLDAGFSVYLVDFGEPDQDDAYVTLDNYVLDWLPAACDAVKQDAEADAVSLLGYCMGGLFALCHAAANLDETVANIVTIASPVDTHRMGLFAWMARHGGRQIETMARHIGNVPGSVSGTAFRLMTPVKNLTRYADLFMNMWDAEYVNGFDAMNQWTSGFIDYPHQAFLQFIHDFMRHNKLVRGKLQFRGKVADLKRVRASLLAFAGQTDSIAPEPSARGVLSAVGSPDKTFRVVPGGHMGVFTGSTAPDHVWAPTAEWLAARSADN